MRTAIKLIFCLTIFFTGQTAELSAQTTATDLVAVGKICRLQLFRARNEGDGDSLAEPFEAGREKGNFFIAFEWSPDSKQIAFNLVLFDWFTKQSSLDSKRVGLRGFSYGGYLAVLAAARFPEKVAAVSAHAAPTNLSTLQANNPAWRVGTSRTESATKPIQKSNRL